MKIKLRNTTSLTKPKFLFDFLLISIFFLNILVCFLLVINEMVICFHPKFNVKCANISK